MKSNEQNKLTRKIETDSENRMTVLWGGWRLSGGGMEQKGDRTHGHGQQCGDYWGQRGIGD